MNRFGMAALGLLVLGACENDGTGPEQQLDEIRRANQQYASVQAASAAGFVTDGMCVDAGMVGAPAALGAMGVHYANPQRLGLVIDAPRMRGTDGVIDPAKPEILIFEPQADGAQRLVAVEYLVFEEAWKAAGHTTPPALFGQEFVYMKDVPGTAQDEAHGADPHYELHVWLYRQNPNGMFAEFNPMVSCANAAAH